MIALQALGHAGGEWLALVLAAFAGGALGAAAGAFPALALSGLSIVAGEAANAVGSPPAAPAAFAGGIGTGITASVGLGPLLGPHVAFAGGAAATAYAARKGYLDTGFEYHEAKHVTRGLGTRPDVLAVGGAFGVLGMALRQGSAALGAPWDPIAAAVVVSAVVHRIALGYPLIGRVRTAGILEMAPYECEELRSPTHGDDAVAEGDLTVERFAVEPWLPHQYRWPGVAAIGLVGGLAGAYLLVATGSVFLGFGLSTASLLFLCSGVAAFPVTHHVTLPAATAAAALAGGTAGAPLLPSLAAGAAFGVLGALVGELAQRVLYAHGDTHFDPPATAILATTLLIALLAIAGVFPGSAWVPVP